MFRCFVGHRALNFSVFLLLMTAFSIAGSDALEGRVTNSEGQPLAGVTVTLGDAEVITNQKGEYSLPMAPTDATLRVLWDGRTMASARVDGQTATHDFTIDTMPTHSLNLVVASTRTDSLAEVNLNESSVHRMPASVTGEVLRQMPGVAAVRRGPVGLDPVVRGLRETEVGTYLDGSRLFPGGPGRMDSGLSHLDPSTIERIQVVKGPYALTWGAGNMGAVKVESFDTQRIRENGGSVFAGYRENQEGAHFAPSIYGRAGKLGWWAHAVDRRTKDYTDGDDVTVPGDMHTREARAKLGADLAGGHFTLSAGYQDQSDIDYPGRLLNADYFYTRNLNLEYDKRLQGNGMLQAYSAQLYYNDVDHGMTNTGKPTAEPNPNRMPPFALAIGVESHITVTGGRFALNLQGSEWRTEAGLDHYRARRDALRTIARAETGMVMVQDNMWPDAVISVSGLFAKSERLVGDAGRLSLSARIDSVDADAGEVTDFFAENVSTETSASETNWSGAVTYHHSLNDTWSLAFGLGSVARTADANERYSDRIPASKAQMSAEFMGNPDLEAERNTQFDLWLEGSGSRWSYSFNGFTRQMDDYITIEATDLPRKLPLSPTTVFRYVNGEAEFYGFETSLNLNISERFNTRFSGEYLRGTDTELDEPAFGVAPLTLRWQGDYLMSGGAHQISLIVRHTEEQDRVGSSRGETPTDGYTLLDLLSDWSLGQSFTLSVGATNLTDKAYTDHLNAKNPFMGTRIQEIGRSLFLDARYRF